MKLLIALLSLAGVAFLVTFSPGHVEITVPLHQPFAHHRGFAYVTKAPHPWSPGTDFTLMEDGRPLGPLSSGPDAIANDGGGAFLEWQGLICLSTSDNSDPNLNGRRYSLRAPGRWFSPGVYLVVIFTTYLGASFLLNGAARASSGPISLIRRTFVIFVNAFVAGLVIQLVFAVLVPYRVSKERKEIQRWYISLFEGGDPGFQPGTSLYFMEHHYLNYTLNPDVQYGDAKQFDRAFRIRRKEAIRPRQAVKWRILILGGSTTFGEGLPREEDTWVYQLEQLVRARYGADFDVINGGVLGYTIAENFIHYVTLLTNLQPDVVLLYTGINDVHPRLFGRLVSDYSNYRRPWRSGASVLPAVNQTWAWLYPYRYYFLTTKILRLEIDGIGGLVSFPYPPPDKWANELEINGAGAYGTYLENLVRLIRAQDRAVGIVPQYFRSRSEAEDVFGKAVDEHNRKNREIASRLSVPFAEAVTDGKTLVPEDVYDDCHFNKLGGRHMAQVMVEFLRTSHLLSEPTRADLPN
jgi:lysophospholipase L1-like esterase